MKEKKESLKTKRASMKQKGLQAQQDAKNLREAADVAISSAKAAEADLELRAKGFDSLIGDKVQNKEEYEKELAEATQMERKLLTELFLPLL